MSPGSTDRTDQTDGDADSSRVRLNVALYAATVICACLALLLAITWWNGRDDRVEGVPVAVGAGDDVGPGVVTPVKLAGKQDQGRIAAQLKAAKTMVTAFVNFDYRDPERTMSVVRSMSTGKFLEQYDAGTKGILDLTKRAEATQIGRVTWAGLVAGDHDSATVIVATKGTVQNKTTKFEKSVRNFRLQLELVLKDSKWLISDLQIVP